MDAVKYLKEKSRLLQKDEYGCCNIDCEECKFNIDIKGVSITCSKFENRYPEKAVEIVEKWAAENPAKTRQSEF